MISERLIIIVEGNINFLERERELLKPHFEL